MAAAPKLIAIGGFAGTGKSTIAGRLARELSIPRLGSDTIGGTIRTKLADLGIAGRAFAAGFEVLFTLTEQLLRNGCSVIVDINLGWAFQWERLDAIRAELPEAGSSMLVLTCPRDVCLARVDARARQEPGEATAAQLSRSPHIEQVWEYLDALDRPDACLVDANRDADAVFAEVLGLVAA